MKKKYCMVIDSSVCIDCKACMVSCKVQHNLPRGHWRNWIKHTDPDFTMGKHTFVHFQPGGCMQCDNPTCVFACPSGATFKDEETGIIHVNEDLCIGCGNCVKACPYGARYRHPTKRVPDKCDFCKQRLDMGLLPACVDTCPTKARTFGDLNDPESEVARLVREHQTVRITTQPVDTKPNMFYLAQTMPVDWPGPVEYPMAHRAMTGLVNPLVKVAVGLSGLGVAAMFLKQIFTSPESSQQDNKEEV
ncbi:4Fe-4S dicluster domain-containing protein [Desulfonatronovibrio hydrogenovorans]|uniref:4Fe-4S dicluster domain-containing protein n=1 Tax=Desulfonatronovibrio hydrogenovorans TaxID=53245 RepID=UPI00048ECCA2|nr:4Fe-4S dicluster domain-containing protein [Desulfonatronovibrio hydrogenovorans]